MDSGSLTFQKKLIFVLICLGNVTITFNIGAVSALIPTMSADFGLSDFVVARVVPYYMVPYGLGALIYAYLTRWVTYRKIMIAAMAAYGAFSLMSGLAQSLDMLLFSQIGAGVAAASSTPLSLMIIGDLFDKDVRGRLVGVFFGTSFLSSLAGMLCMGFLPWRWIFLIPAALGLLTAAFIFIQRTGLLARRHEENIDYFKVFTRGPIRRIFAFIFVMSCLYHAVYKWYGVYLSQQYAMDNKGISLFLILAAGCGLIGQQVGGYFSDKKGRMFSCRVGMAILCVGTVALSAHFPQWFVPLVLGGISMGWTIHHNSISTVLTDFPDEDRPMVSSLNSSVRFISGGLGFSLSQVFVERSFSWTFLGIGVVFLVMNFFLAGVVPAGQTK